MEGEPTEDSDVEGEPGFVTPEIGDSAKARECMRECTWLAQAVEIEPYLSHVPDDPVHVVGLLERILASWTWTQLPSKIYRLLCLSWTYGSLVLFYLHLQRVSGLSFIYMAAHAGNVNVWRMDGCTLSRSWKPLMDCLKEQKPPQGYTTLALQPFSVPTDMAALPLHLHHLALLTPLPLNFIQPPSAPFLSISQLPFFISSYLTLLHFVYISQSSFLLWFFICSIIHCILLHPSNLAHSHVYDSVVPTSQCSCFSLTFCFHQLILLHFPISPSSHCFVPLPMLLADCDHPTSPPLPSGCFECHQAFSVPL